MDKQPVHTLTNENGRIKITRVKPPTFTAYWDKDNLQLSDVIFTLPVDESRAGALIKKAAAFAKSEMRLKGFAI